MRIDGKTKAEIARVCRWAREDSFWGGNFLSPVKLRKKNKDSIPYFDVFSHRMTHETTTDRRTPSRSLKDNSSLDGFAAFDRQQMEAHA